MTTNQDLYCDRLEIDNLYIDNVLYTSLQYQDTEITPVINDDIQFNSSTSTTITTTASTFVQLLSAATLTINLPSVTEGRKIKFYFKEPITSTLTFNPTLVNWTPSSIAIDDNFYLVYTSTGWYKI